MKIDFTFTTHLLYLNLNHEIFFLDYFLLQPSISFVLTSGPPVLSCVHFISIHGSVFTVLHATMATSVSIYKRKQFKIRFSLIYFCKFVQFMNFYLYFYIYLIFAYKHVATFLTDEGGDGFLFLIKEMLILLGQKDRSGCIRYLSPPYGLVAKTQEKLSLTRMALLNFVRIQLILAAKVHIRYSNPDAVIAFLMYSEIQGKNKNLRRRPQNPSITL